MAILLATLFVGITFVADAFGIVPNDSQTVIAQVAATVYGDGSIGFYLFQAFTALILILAANTSYNAFPQARRHPGRGQLHASPVRLPRRPPGLHAGHRHPERPGHRLLVILFGGDTHALIPLYSVGVFVSFTLSQGGMVRHWRRVRDEGWRRRLGINAVGAVLTGVVLGRRPGREGSASSLLVAVIIPVLVGADAVHRAPVPQQRDGARGPRGTQVIGPPQRQERVVIPVPGLNRAVVQAVQLRSIARRRRADGPRHRRRRGGRASCARASSGSCPASRSSSSSRRSARWCDRS